MKQIAMGLILKSMLFATFVQYSCLLAGASDLVRTTDGTRTLINKDVNGERWAITYDAVRSSVSGNVTLPDGGVQFIDCLARDVVGENVPLLCESPQGDDWGSIGEVDVPASFLGIDAGSCSYLDSVGNSYAWILHFDDSCNQLVRSEMELSQIACEVQGTTENSDNPRFDGALFHANVGPDNHVQATLSFTGLCTGAIQSDLVLVQSGPQMGQKQYAGDYSGSLSCCPQASGRLTIAFGYE
jgi:hypothetical protein